MMFLGVLFVIVGTLLPSLLFPHENRILAGFVGAPFVLVGLLLMLVASFPARRPGDRRRDDDDGGPPDRPAP